MDNDTPMALRSVAQMKAAIMVLVDRSLRAVEHEGTLELSQIGIVSRLLEIIDKIQRMEDPEPQQSGKSTAEILGLK